MSIIRYIFLIFIILSGFSLRVADAQLLFQEDEPPENYQLQIFLEKDEALDRVFAGCDSVESEFLVLTPEGHAYFKDLLKRPDLETTFEVYIGKKKGVIDRYAIITEEMGCFHPITWILSVDTRGKILDIAVMIYRESRGQEVTRRRFLAQFEGKTPEDPISVNKDILKITGATVSVAAVCRGVRKMLTFIQEFYIKKGNAYATLARRLSPEEVATLTTETKRMLITAQFIDGTKVVLSAEAGDEIGFFSTAKKAFKEIERIERLFSDEITVLNRVAWKKPYRCNEEVFRLIKRCYQYSKLTDGAFDITAFPLLKKTGIYKGQYKTIKENDLSHMLTAVSYKNMELNNTDKTIFFRHKGTRIDPGLVVKGYALDKAIEVIKEGGITCAYMNYGYVSRMLDPPSGKSFWNVGVPHPLKEGYMIGSLRVANRGIAFVADYSQCPAVQDETYLHLIDPRNGKPVTRGMLSATITAGSAERAAAIATAIFVEGRDGIDKFYPVFPDMKWMLLYKESYDTVQFLVSPEVAKRFRGGEEKAFRFSRGAGCSFSP